MSKRTFIILCLLSVQSVMTSESSGFSDFQDDNALTISDGWEGDLEEDSDVQEGDYDFLSDLIDAQTSDLNNEEEIFDAERKLFLGYVKMLAPELSDLIIKVDPTGKDHIQRLRRNAEGIQTFPSRKDGLPIIEIGSDVYRKFTSSEILFIMGHELSHYVLQHNTDLEDRQDYLQHPKLKVIPRSVRDEERDEDGYPLETWKNYAKGKRVKGLLEGEQAFRKAYSRTLEFEADRASIILFSPTQEAISAGLTAIDKLSQPKIITTRTTFKEGHPLNLARKQQLEELRCEVELIQARDDQRKHLINWENLQRVYMNRYQRPEVS